MVFVPTAPKSTLTKTTNTLFEPNNETSSATESTKGNQNNNTHETELNNNNFQTQIHNFLEQQKQDFFKNNKGQKGINNNNRNSENNDSTQELKSPKPDIQTKDKKEDNDTNYINICTHNTRGINKQTDQDNILQECKKQKIDILGLCETKLTNNAANFSFKD